MSLEEMIAKNQLLVSEASLQKLKFERQQSVLNAGIYTVIEVHNNLIYLALNGVYRP